MASSGTLAAGIQSYSSTLTAATADTVTFTDRYGYVTVTNTGTGTIYARADGTAATVAGNNSFPIQAGQTQVFANGAQTWYPSSRVIPAGTDVLTNGSTISSQGNPAIVQPYMSSLAGQKANPGTVVSLISSVTPTYTVSGTG
jgi:hypothetical protein